GALRTRRQWRPRSHLKHHVAQESRSIPSYTAVRRPDNKRKALCTMCRRRRCGSTDMLTIPDDELRQWLAEDVPYGDLTTHALETANPRGRTPSDARKARVAAGGGGGGRIMALAGAGVIAGGPWGPALQPGGLLLAAKGPAAALHAGGKVSQTLLKPAGGIAAA